MSELEKVLFGQGYLLLRSVVAGSAIENALGEVARVRRRAVNVGESEWRIERAEEILSISELLSGVAFRRQLSRLIGEGCVLILNRHNHIGISAGQEYRSARLHRDALQHQRSYLTLLLPLAVPEGIGGMVRLVPGSHLLPPLGNINGGGFWLDETPFSELASQALYVHLQPGDVILMNPMLFHGAGHGQRGSERVMLSLGVHGGDELKTRDPAEQEVRLWGQHRHAGQAWAEA